MKRGRWGKQGVRKASDFVKSRVTHKCVYVTSTHHRIYHSPRRLEAYNESLKGVYGFEKLPPKEER